MNKINGKLKGRIIEKFNTIRDFAKAMGKTQNTITAKLKGTSPWKTYEIDLACKLLDISQEQISLYFLP